MATLAAEFDRIRAAQRKRSVMTSLDDFSRVAEAIDRLELDNVQVMSHPSIAAGRVFVLTEPLDPPVFTLSPEDWTWAEPDLTSH